jgi:protein SCO1/2
MQKNGVNDKKMEFATGKKEIYTMARKSYLAVKLGKPSELYDMVHTENFVLVDAKKEGCVAFMTVLIDIKKLIIDINFLSNE